MLDIKNMTDSEIGNETRQTNKPYMLPTGVIKLTLESSITNNKGEVFQNEPKTLFYETSASKDIDAIFNQNATYPLMVNQLVERFKEGMWETQTGPLRVDNKDVLHLFRKIHALCSQLSDEDIKLLNRILKILGINV